MVVEARVEVLSHHTTVDYTTEQIIIKKIGRSKFVCRISVGVRIFTSRRIS